MLKTHTRRSARIALATSVAAATVLGTGVVASSAASAAAPQHHASQNFTHVYRTKLTAAQIAQYSKNQNQRVIVLLKDQLNSTLSGGDGALNSRASALSRAQASIHSELASLHAPHLISYHFVNALAAQVSAAEAKRLAQNPSVLAVVPDAKVTLPKREQAAPSSAHAANPVNTTPGICGTAKNPLAPEALQQIGAAAPHYGITGKGVKIAVFPDGLDPNNTDFVRPDGSKAVFDYKDFTGDGPNGVTDGAEAYGDVSSIVSQGRKTFDLSKVVNPNLPLPANCDIKVVGVAPGASVAVMKIFGTGSSFDSLILDGLDYAVSHDHVNILSESFGGNTVPNAATDPTSLFNALAVQHGITVVASSGDAGITNTIGSPASSNAGLISAGATTSFQQHAQLSEHGYQLGHYKGWESKNIATLSSGGFTDYGPNTVDVVAPGDGNWVDCSTDINTFLSCGNGFGGANQAPGVTTFGGTSEACPLTAATAALVIEAYRDTHKGATPSPAVVKKIIMSSADDLNMPVEEQGAGEVNARRAVELARSYSTKTPTGTTAAIAPNKIETVGVPGSAHSQKIYVHNTSGTTRTIAPTLEQFTAPMTVASKTFTIDPTSKSTPTFTYWLTGTPEPYAEVDFAVPSGYQRLNVRFGYPADQTDANQVAFEVLIDPQGKLAQDSDPQGGPGGFGQGDVRNPIAGKWRAIYFTRPGSDQYKGSMTMQATVQKLVRSNKGTISPASQKIGPNGLGVYTLVYPTPIAPGDASMEVNFGPRIGVIPVLTRSLAVPTTSKAATFSGELTTGNGRMAFPSQELPFQFTVPSGVKDVDVNVHVADAGYVVGGVLAAPNQTPVAASETTFEDVTQATPTQTPGQDFSLTWQHPQPGTWSVDLFSMGGSGSGKVSTTVSGTIAFNTVSVTATGVPNSSATKLTAGKTVTASVKVTNTGTAPKIYFIDPRRSGTSTYSLGFVTSPNGTLPVRDVTNVPQFLVPPQTTSLTAVASTSKPAAFSISPFFGTPEIESTQGTTPSATFASSNVPATEWSCGVALLGPFPKAAPDASYSCGAFATTATIDDAVQATGGNVWDMFTDPNSPNVFAPTQAVVVQPGKSTTLTVAITPSAADVDGTVSGYLAVQSFDAETLSGDDLVHIPYQYSVTAPPTAG